MLGFGAKNLKEFVEIWNKKIPIDRWYRQKYNIAFGSEEHKKVNLANMFFEFYEFMYNKYKIQKKEVVEEEPYQRGKGNFMKEIYSKQDIDRIFEELDIDNID